MNNKRGHYQISSFACNLCQKEIRDVYLLDTPKRSIVCKSHADGTLILRTCQHCGHAVESIGIVEWMNFPLEERANPLRVQSKAFSKQDFEVLMKNDKSEKWCASCIATLLEQSHAGKVHVFDFLTMDEEG